MPSVALKKWAEESGKSMKEAEEAWEECKTSANSKFDKEDELYWSYVNVCTRSKLGLVKKSSKTRSW